MHSRRMVATVCSSTATRMAGYISGRLMHDSNFQVSHTLRSSSTVNLPDLPGGLMRQQQSRACVAIIKLDRDGRERESAHGGTSTPP